jgi:response regulator NasT
MSRVLVLDSDAQRAVVLHQGLTDANHEVIVPERSNAHVPELVKAFSPDVIIIDTDSPDRDTLEHICIVSANAPPAIVMFSGDPNSEKIREAVKAGVSAYVVGGPSAERIQPILDVAVARDPQQSFETAEELLLALERGDTRPVVPPSPTALVHDRVTRWQAVAVVLFALNLLLLYHCLLR